jgi:hypothetical protein
MIVRAVCDGYIAVLEERKPPGMPSRWFGELRTEDDEPIKEWISGATSRRQNYGYPVAQARTEVEVMESLTRRAEQLDGMKKVAAR